MASMSFPAKPLVESLLPALHAENFFCANLLYVCFFTALTICGLLHDCSNRTHCTCVCVSEIRMHYFIIKLNRSATVQFPRVNIRKLNFYIPIFSHSLQSYLFCLQYFSHWFVPGPVSGRCVLHKDQSCLQTKSQVSLHLKGYRLHLQIYPSTKGLPSFHCSYISVTTTRLQPFELLNFGWLKPNKDKINPSFIFLWIIKSIP